MGPGWVYLSMAALFLLGIDLLGVCVRKEFRRAGYLGWREGALKDIWCGMVLVRYVNAFIDMYEEVRSATILFNPT